MSDQTAFLEVRDLSAGYGGSPAVAGISFSLERGEILSLVGESGCGKSTLLRAIMGTEPDLCLLSGSIRLEGTELTALPPRERLRFVTRRCGMVFQSPGASFNPIRSYRSQFIETLKSRGKYDKKDFLPRAEAALLRLGLEEPRRVLDSCPYELSGGMNQRVALALALLLGQELLLADEPTSALDAAVQLQAAAELKSLGENAGIAQIVVTHNLALARYLGGRIGVMYAGRLVELATAEDLLREPRHPYTRALMEAIPQLDGTMPRPLAGQLPAEGPALPGCPFFPRCSRAIPACRETPCTLAPWKGEHLLACCRAGEETP